MGNISGKIIAPIGVEPDIYKVTGSSRYNGWFDLGAICSNLKEKTNKSSRYKPVKYRKLQDITAQELRSTNFGLVSKKAVIPGVPPKLRSEEWDYDPPSGGYGEPFRTNDFNGYNHNAQWPIRLNVHEITYDKSSDINAVVIDASFIIQGDGIINAGKYGDTKNIEIGINELMPGGTSLRLDRLYWGLAYVSGNTIYVANSENCMDLSAKCTNVSPGVVKLGNWALGNLLKSLPVGTVSLVPIINPTQYGTAKDEIGNGTIDDNAYCFPDGKVLKVNIIDSGGGTSGGTKPNYEYLATGGIKIYWNNNQIGEFGIFSDKGYLSVLGGPISCILKAEYSVANPSDFSEKTIFPQDYSLDLRDFPQDPMYEISDLPCVGITTDPNSTVSERSIKLAPNEEKVIYFMFTTSTLKLTQAFAIKEKYTGTISLININSGIKVCTARYNISQNILQ